MAEVTLPQLGETVTEGTITRWFKKVGDTVAADEPLFEVSTDKVDTEVPSPIAGHAQRDPRPRGRHGAGRHGDRRRRRGRRRRRRAAGRSRSPRPAGRGTRTGAGAAAEPAAEPAAPRRADARARARRAADPCAGRPPAPAPAAAPRAEPRRGRTGVRRRGRRQPSAVAGGAPSGRRAQHQRRPARRHRSRRPHHPRRRARLHRSWSPRRPPQPTAPHRPPAPARRPGPRTRCSPGCRGPAAAVARRRSPPAGERDSTVRLSKIRKLTGSHMVMSKGVSPHAFSVVEVDFANVDVARNAVKAEWKAAEGFGLTYLPFITRAVDRSDRRVPAPQRQRVATRTSSCTTSSTSASPSISTTRVCWCRWCATPRPSGCGRSPARSTTSPAGPAAAS